MAPPSLSFTPWARDVPDATSLKDVLARVNLERGHFRDITEASLQEEIAAEGALDLSESSSDEGEEKPEEQVAAKKTPQTREDLFRARAELLEHVSKAEQDILMSLDFVSLLQTKQSLNPAATTISPVLKSSVPMGSLGADVWKAAPIDKTREAQDSVLASTLRIGSLHKSADDLLAAAARLNDNVRRETQYWQQILSISQRGWSISKIPRQGHMLGVHFGFSGSAPEFAQRNLAALVSDQDGNVTLERGIGSKPKAMRAVIRQGGKVVGSSTLPSIPDLAETTLQARIRYARDSVYDEELYHEMIRESRMLASQGISVRGSNVSFALPSPSFSVPGRMISFELVSLDEDNTIDLVSAEWDFLAQASLLAARLLLGQSHRERLRRKADIPPPLTEKTAEKPTFPILRPLMLLLQHQADIHQLNTYISDLASLLKRAGIEVTYDFLKFSSPHPAFDEPASVSSAITTTLLSPASSFTSLTVKPPSEGNGGTSLLTLSLAIETHPTSSLQPTFILTTHPGKQHRFNFMPDFLSATDDAIASALTQALHVVASAEGTDWTCDVRECRLKKRKIHFSEADEELFVDVDIKHGGQKARLVLGGAEGNEVTWSLPEDEEGKQGGKVFWEAWKEIGLATKPTE